MAMTAECHVVLALLLAAPSYARGPVAPRCLAADTDPPNILPELPDATFLVAIPSAPRRHLAADSHYLPVALQSLRGAWRAHVEAGGEGHLLVVVFDAASRTGVNGGRPATHTAFNKLAARALAAPLRWVEGDAPMDLAFLTAASVSCMLHEEVDAAEKSLAAFRHPGWLPWLFGGGSGAVTTTSGGSACPTRDEMADQSSAAAQARSEKSRRKPVSLAKQKQALDYAFLLLALSRYISDASSSAPVPTPVLSYWRCDRMHLQHACVHPTLERVHVILHRICSTMRVGTRNVP